MKTLMLLMALAVPAAGFPAPGRETKADIRGRITQVRPVEGGERILVMLVEGAPGAEANYDKASVTVTRGTRIFLRRGRARRRAGIGALEPGRLVEARFTGPVLESYPVQATAAEVVILD